jgi:hypothetical protein
LAGLLNGFVFAMQFKTPDYVKDIQYDWEKPDFNPQEDPFMKRFDENGNFVNPPKPEELEVIEQEVVSQPIQYVYVFKEHKDDEPVSE